MAKVLTAEELKAKLEKWRPRFVRINNDAKGANLKVGEEKAKKLDGLFNEVKNSGLSLKGFKQAMTALDHLDKAKGKRPEMVEDQTDEEVMQTFDSIMIITPDALPLFASAEQREMKKAAEARVKAAEEEKPAEDEKKPASGRRGVASERAAETDIGGDGKVAQFPGRA